MRFTLILENAAGDRIDMTKTANQYMISKIDGLYPPAGTISTTPYAGMNGSYLNNAFIEKRNLVLSFEMRGYGSNIELNRHALYRVVKTAQYLKVYYRTVGIDVYTEGYVESCTVTNFGELVNGQISIICPDPYWYSTQSIYAYSQSVFGAFHFPFPESDEPFPLGVYSTDKTLSIFNSGEEVGILITLEAASGEDIPTPVATGVTLYDDDTKTYFQLLLEILPSDKIIINTKQGQKSVTLVRDGVTTNIINCMTSGSIWFTLRKGLNRYRLSASKYITATIQHTDAYLGV